MDTYTAVTRILRVALGEYNEHGDGEIVTDVISGYAEPGYGSDESVVVLGNWNPKRWVREGDEPLTPAENLGPRLYDALTRVGAECEWLDEWSSCQGCYKAVRTEPDSYSWKPAYAWVEDCELYCHTCLIGMGEDALGDLVNNSQKCLTWADSDHLESMGFVKWAPGDEQDYASGWYPGQTDEPPKILDTILTLHPDAEVVFYLDSTGQFDIRFSAYVRGLEDDDDV